MSSTIADYASGAELLEGLHAFLVKGHTMRPTWNAVGDGYCDDAIGTTTSVFETITLTFTSATTFDVVGSVSTAMGSGTVGTLFTHARFACTIVAGTTPFQAGDSVVWVMTAPWTPLVYVAGQSYIYRAHGNDNNSEINVGMTVKSNSTGGYYGARLGAYPVWLSKTTQYKKCTFPWWPLGSYAGSACRLFVVANGDSFYAVCRVGTYYMAAGAGYMDTIATRAKVPAPYWVGGCVSWSSEPGDTSTSWKYDIAPIAAPFFPEIIIPPGGSESYINIGGSPMYVRSCTGNWLRAYKTSSDGFTRMTPRLKNSIPSRLGTCLDGSFPLWPVHMQAVPAGHAPSLTGVPTDAGSAWAMKEHLGYIPFVYFTSSYDDAGNLMIAESTVRDKTTRSKLMFMQPGADSSATYLYMMEMV